MSSQTLPAKTASQRQKEYVERKKADGLVVLTSCYVPQELLSEVRTLVKNHVENYLSNKANQKGTTK